jgi:2-polyprenyl-3-methyl-5-hydroxy-6-metoxy-1,4-benzoquinol methylase
VSNKLDLFGTALWDYKKIGYKQDNNLESQTEEDLIHLCYFFRFLDKIRKLEQKVLKLSKGKFLDVGCGSGIHSLYIKNKMKL